ncbi:MAG: hypothetical protein EAZ07_06950 [Cytophagales bacterium]|nr:MAG: hypothetical protein EAZ07_06950 [Cytophagales bacterium]
MAFGFLFVLYYFLKKPSIKSIMNFGISIVGNFIYNILFRNLSSEDKYFLESIIRESNDKR